MKLLALLVAAEAARIHEFDQLNATDISDGSGPKGSKGQVLMLVPGSEFQSMEHPVLSHQLEVKSGEDMVLEIQEVGAGGKANGYEVFLVQKNGQVQVGKIASKPSSTVSSGLKWDFRTTDGKPMVRMLMPWRKPSGQLTAHITSVSKKNAYTYYTFDNKVRNVFTLQGTMRQQPEEVFTVNKGKSFGVNDAPYVQAKGHFKGFSFKFWMAGQDKPVANMQMIDSSTYNVYSGAKQRFRVTINAGVDPVMISMLIGFIDFNNR